MTTTTPKKVRYRTEVDITKRVDRYYIKRSAAEMELAALEQALSTAKLTGESVFRINSLTRNRGQVVDRLDRIGRRLDRLKDRLATLRTPEFSSIACLDSSIPA